jgi:fumarylacetoacetase
MDARRGHLRGVIKMPSIDRTHDPTLRSWVESANGHSEFPIQNLPLGVFSPQEGKRRGGFAIGDSIFDMAAAVRAGLFTGAARRPAELATDQTLNRLMALQPSARQALRQRLSDLLSTDGPDRTQVEGLKNQLLHSAADCTVHVPARIGDYTDFFTSIHHASNTGRLFRGGADPVSPNFRHLPIAYHGRASSVRVSGESVRRPHGQIQYSPGEAPRFGPCEKLDYEYELGVWIGNGNALGEPIQISEAGSHVVGHCLLNDWSARDIQRWESQPLGPFLGKNFSTTISPWIVTVEALAPFRVPQAPRSPGDPNPLPYLWDEDDQKIGALDCTIEAFLLTPGLAAKGLPPQRLSRANATDLYWTFAQMVAHHSSGGCNLNPGDLFGSGTISGASSDGWGALLELSENGQRTIELGSGEKRTFLENGDEVIFRAHCCRDGFVPIGFGECRGRITE